MSVYSLSLNFAAVSEIRLQHYRITKDDRIRLMNQKPAILWLTGLSGSGKSTIADRLEQELYSNGFKTYLLDGDNVRHGLNKDIGFDAAGRKENIRRIGEVAKLMTDAGLIVITAFISPFRDDRDSVRNLAAPGEFMEIYINCPLSVCEQRDVKGLYARARKGEIPDFTGISSPFEAPLNPDVEVFSDKYDVDACVNQILGEAYKKIKV
jgi:adenylyl-sulfate kinase